MFGVFGGWDMLLLGEFDRFCGEMWVVVRFCFLECGSGIR